MKNIYTDLKKAFSLVEVTLALGIVATSLLLLVGLLPAGLQSIRDAVAQSAALNVTSRLETVIRGAVRESGSIYTSPGEFGPVIQWQMNGGMQEILLRISETGELVTPAEATMMARIELLPPSDLWTPGRAEISIAWPANSANWNAADERWENVSGSLTNSILFLPPL